MRTGGTGGRIGTWRSWTGPGAMLLASWAGGADVARRQLAPRVPGARDSLQDGRQIRPSHRSASLARLRRTPSFTSCPPCGTYWALLMIEYRLATRRTGGKGGRTIRECPDLLVRPVRDASCGGVPVPEASGPGPGRISGSPCQAGSPSPCSGSPRRPPAPHQPVPAVRESPLLQPPPPAVAGAEGRRVVEQAVLRLLRGEVGELRRQRVAGREENLLAMEDGGWPRSRSRGNRARGCGARA
jgi:hypothetical protein